MIKKILIILLSAILGLSVLSGCSLFVLDETKDAAEAVAIIKSRTFDIRVLQEDGSYTEDKFISEEKEISKAALANAYNQYASEYQKDGTKTVEETFDAVLDLMVNRELLIIEAERLIATNELKMKQSEINEIWKNVYTSLDDMIYSFETEIAKEYEEDIYIRGEGTEKKPDWATLVYANLPEEAEIEYETVNGVIQDEAAWTPEVSRGPIFDFEIINNGTDEQRAAYFQTPSYREAARKTEALKRFLNFIKENVEPEILSKADYERYMNDLKVINSYTNAMPYKYVEMYKKLQDLWIIKYLYYDNAYSNKLFVKLQEFIEGDISVSNEEIQTYYNKLFAEQQLSFKTTANYLTAQKDATNLIVYHPANVKWFNVKHILLKFDEAQTAKITTLKSLYGDGTDMFLSERKKMAKQITAYAHPEGYNEGDPISVISIMNEVNSKMMNLEGKSNSAENMFEDLIFKYNMDEGMFNNVNGYGMQYLSGGDVSSTGYMKEFSEASFKLYERYISKNTNAYGSIIGTSVDDMVITDYGVHILMLSSVAQPGQKTIGEHTSVFADGLHDFTFREAIEKKLLEQKKTDAFTNYQNQILIQLNREWENHMDLFPKRYERLIKNAKG